MPRSRSSSRKRSGSSGLRSRDLNSDDDDDETQKRSRHLSVPVNDENNDNDEEQDEEAEFQFTQQAPEMSQPILPVRQSERKNLEQMGSSNRVKAITDLSRHILFKALAGEPIDRLKCAKDCHNAQQDQKIASAVLDEAASNLRNVFGFELRRVPKFMEKHKSFSTKYKDRLYVINQVADNDDGDGAAAFAAHSRAIHSVHPTSAVEKGLLMLILAYCFCKGEPRPDGSRWLDDVALYRLLHGVDENIPDEPPSVANRKVSVSTGQNRLLFVKDGGDGGGVGMTPNVDALLVQFVERDYLLREKKSESSATAGQAVTDHHHHHDVFQYSMGPRAAMEIGRRQIIYFCSEILDEKEPDPTMLQEMDQEDAEDEYEPN
jgi:hypothetical protein